MPTLRPCPTRCRASRSPARIVTEIQQTVDDAVARFQGMDEAGLLALVSDEYRTGSLTKAGIAEQLRAVFSLHD